MTVQFDATAAASAYAAPWLEHAAKAYGDRPALYARCGTRRYADLYREVLAIAGQLAGAGLGVGCRAALLLSNALAGVRAVHAVQAAGAVIVPLHTRLRAEDLQQQLEHVAPTLLLHDATTHQLAQRASADLANLPLVDVGSLDPGAAPLAAPLVRPPSTDQVILFTSGTSGRPKAVRLSRQSLRAAALASAERLGHYPSDSWLLCMPAYHVGGLSVLTRAAMFGMAVHLHERFDANAVSDALATGECTLASLVPTMLARVLDALGQRRCSERVRAILIGGGPIAPALLDRARSAGLPVAPTYGLSEAASQVTTLAPRAVRDGETSAGPPLPETEVRIEDGEVLVRSPTLMTGYLDDPDATAKALRDGWLHTGDAGEIDAEGNLHVLDRRSDLIVSGGENIAPSEIEAVLVAHPDVEDAAVVGRPDTEWGQRVEAHLVCRPGSEAAEDEVLAWCRRHLPGFKVPQRVHWEEDLPRSATGKLQRQALRRRHRRGSP